MLVSADQGQQQLPVAVPPKQHPPGVVARQGTARTVRHSGLLHAACSWRCVFVCDAAHRPCSWTCWLCSPCSGCCGQHMLHASPVAHRPWGHMQSAPALCRSLILWRAVVSRVVTWLWRACRGGRGVCWQQHPHSQSTVPPALQRFDNICMLVPVTALLQHIRHTCPQQQCFGPASCCSPPASRQPVDLGTPWASVWCCLGREPGGWQPLEQLVACHATHGPHPWHSWTPSHGSWSLHARGTRVQGPRTAGALAVTKVDGDSSQGSVWIASLLHFAGGVQLQVRCASWTQGSMAAPLPHCPAPPWSRALTCRAQL